MASTARRWSSSSTASSTAPVGIRVVHGLGGARDELAACLEHELVANLAREGCRLGRPLGVDHELRDSRAVAQVDEDEAAVVTSP